MAIFQRNAELGSPIHSSSWRRIALGAWRTSHDPALYGFLDLDAGPALDYISAWNARAPGTHLKLTHFIVKAIAETLKRHPELNSVLRWGRIYPRRHVDIFVMVATDRAGEDLSGRNIRGADRKDLFEIAGELEGSVDSIRKLEDTSYRGMKNFYKWLPGIFSRLVMRMLEKFLVTFNLWSPLFGFPRDAFGSVMVSNIGSLGLDRAFGALVPFSGSPLFVTYGAVREVPVVKNGKLEISRQITLGVTTDHRLIDGVQGGRMAAMIRDIFANPASIPVLSEIALGEPDHPAGDSAFFETKRADHQSVER